MEVGDARITTNTTTTTRALPRNTETQVMSPGPSSVRLRPDLADPPGDSSQPGRQESREWSRPAKLDLNSSPNSSLHYSNHILKRLLKMSRQAYSYIMSIIDYIYILL